MLDFGAWPSCSISRMLVVSPVKSSHGIGDFMLKKNGRIQNTSILVSYANIRLAPGGVVSIFKPVGASFPGLDHYWDWIYTLYKFRDIINAIRRVPRDG